jgi:hypothetical protein
MVMSSWQEFQVEQPDLAAAVQERFDAHDYKVLGTVRRDGSPRLSGVEISVRDGELWLGGLPGSVKFVDLRRDPRFALHSGSDDPSSWRGDAKIAGTAMEIVDEATKADFVAAAGEMPPGPFELFRLELTEAVVVQLGEPADHLVIDSWHQGRGRNRVERR